MKDNPSRTSWLNYLPHAIILIVGVTFSLFLFYVIHFEEEVHLQREFQRMAQNRVLALERSIHGKIGILKSVRCFFEGSEFVQRDEFNTFTDSFSDFSEIYIMAWVPKVKGSERAKCEAEAQAEVPDFFIQEQNQQGEFVPAQIRPEYFPVYYIKTYTKQNTVALGYDIASDEAKYQALVRACDNNLAVATEKLQFVRNQGCQNSFLILLPVYQKKMPIDTISQRRENLEGFVVGVFDIQVLVEHAMSLTDLEHISIYISDVTAKDDEQFLYYYTSNGSTVNGDNAPLPLSRLLTELHTTDVIDVGTRQWSLVCIPQQDLIDLYMTGNAWAVLAIGLLLTFLSFLYFLFSWRKTEAIQRLVDIRTEELQQELENRTKAEKQLAKIAEQLEKKNDELERVIYIASHDLRSPLITIAGFDNELQKSCEELKGLLYERVSSEQSTSEVRVLLDEAIPESLSFITAGIEKAQMLIEGLLQVSRIGTSPFKIVHISMNQLISDVVDIERFQAKIRNADIIVEDLPDCMGDAAKTNQVFSNLIDNALKYLAVERTGKIIISGSRDGERCVYCVEDNGIGIEFEYQSHIFQMFNRVCSDPSIKGEGLGLSIVARILEGQDGEIWLESEPGKGSKFYISLPSA